MLIGATGAAKTTVCQLWAELFHQKLHILNCHQHTETADFLGGLRPIRGREQLAQQLKTKILQLFSSFPPNEQFPLSEDSHLEEILEQLDNWQNNNEKAKQFAVK